MKSTTTTQPDPPAAQSDDNHDANYVAELLGLYRGKQRTIDTVKVTSWAEDRGVLDNGLIARTAASCLLRPQAGDKVLSWNDDSGAWVLAILERCDNDAPTKISAPGSLHIEAPRVALQGQVVQVAARDFLTCSQNRHAVENTRTENSRLRVSRIGTDIREVTTSEDRVAGTMLQRVGTWLSTTAHEARLKARTFLFE